MQYGRLFVFSVATICLAAGVVMVARQPSGSPWAGILVRVGALLLVTGVAWPQLSSLRTRSSIFSLTVIFFMLLLIAARPRLFPIAGGVALGALLLNGLLRRLSGKSPGKAGNGRPR